IPLPRSAGLARIDQRVDGTQLGVLALTLFLGRMLKDDEYSAKLVDVANSFQTMGVTGDLEPLRPGLGAWLTRALQFDQHSSLTTAAEARIELESLMTDDERSAGAASMDRLLTRFGVKAPEPVVVRPPEASKAPEPVKHQEPVRHQEAVKHQEPVRHYEPLKHPEPVRHHEPIVVAAPSPLPPSAPPAPPAPAASVIVPLAARVEVPSPQPATDMRFKQEPAVIAARKPQQSPWMRMAVAAAVIAFLTTAGLYAVRRRAAASDLPAGKGTLMVQSNPSGVPIDIDGKASGVTPATLSLTAGPHTLQLRAGGEPKTMTVSVTAGAQISQYIELAKT